LVKTIVEILPITSAGVTLISPGREPHYVAASDASAMRYEELQSQLDEGPCLAAYRTGEAVSVPDLGAKSASRCSGPAPSRRDWRPYSPFPFTRVSSDANWGPSISTAIRRGR
jgi:hypothetical protein